MSTGTQLVKDMTVVGQIRTFSGLYVRPYALEMEDISIVDIAHSLARICRYQGHCNHFMSVAQHCWNVSHRVPVGLTLTALLHDASEAYLGDMPRPLKQMPEMEFYREAEERAHEVIAKKFGAIYPHPPEVIEADRAQLQFEFENLRDAEYPYGQSLPEEAEEFYLKYFHLYRGNRDKEGSARSSDLSRRSR